MYIGMCECGCLCVIACTQRSEDNPLEVTSLLMSLPYCVQAADTPSPGSAFHLEVGELGLQVHPTMSAFSVGSRSSNCHVCMLSTSARWASPSALWNGFQGTVPDCSWWFLVETRAEFGYMVDIQEKSHFVFHSSVVAHVFNKLDVPMLLLCWVFWCNFNF